MNRSRLLTGSLLGILAILVGFSVYLALTRIYQVDECQNFYMAKVFARGESKEFFTNASLFLFGPLSWLARSGLRSAEMFTDARMIFLGVFWLNIVLMASIASGRLRSLRGLIALVAAATLAPVWDYGFEVRHDNLVLTGVLLIWWLARVKPLGIPSYVLAGVITVTLLFIAVKAVVYVIPLSFAIMAFPPPGHRKSRWQLIAAWVGGAVLTAVIVRLSYGFSGAWDTYLSVFRGISNYTTGNGSSGKFAPWSITLGRLPGQTPLLLALVTAGLALVAGDLLRRRRAALTWEGLLPEALLLLGALGVLIINPTPFPYNLVNLVPYAFIFAFKYAVEIGKEVRTRAILWPAFATILVFVHLVPFALATRRHLDKPNARQQQLMRLAEDMTDPAKDPVYDAIGMVLTRPTIHYHWYIHSLATALITKPGFRVRDMLAAKPAPVFIPSYRTDWLPPDDHKFIEQRYVPLADDFEVLGSVLPAGGGSFEIFHPGRYAVVPANSLRIAGKEASASVESGSPITGTLDGTPLSNKPVLLTAGTHRLETLGDRKAAVVWVGPTLDSVPRLPPRSHHALFVNWY